MEGVLLETENMLAHGRMDLPLSLCFATMRGDDLLLNQLLRRGLDPNESDNSGRTPLVSMTVQRFRFMLTQLPLDKNHPKYCHLFRNFSILQHRKEARIACFFYWTLGQILTGEVSSFFLIFDGNLIGKFSLRLVFISVLHCDNLDFHGSYFIKYIDAYVFNTSSYSQYFDIL